MTDILDLFDLCEDIFWWRHTSSPIAFFAFIVLAVVCCFVHIKWLALVIGVSILFATAPGNMALVRWLLLWQRQPDSAAVFASQPHLYTLSQEAPSDWFSDAYLKRVKD